QRADEVVGIRGQRLRQRLPAAAALVALQGEGVRLVPARGEDRGERVGHDDSLAGCDPPGRGDLPASGAWSGSGCWPGLGDAESAGEGPDVDGPEPARPPSPCGCGSRPAPAACPPLPDRAPAGSGARQPCSSASLRPTRLAGPADGPSVAWSSLKPARIRDASRQVHSRPGPRVGRTGFPARRSSTSWRADSGVWLSKNSQFTITTGA